MPVEIKELHIKVAVHANHGGHSDAQAQGGQGAQGGGDKDAIVSECIEQILQILEAKKER